MDLANNSLMYEIQLMIVPLSRDSGLTRLGENLCNLLVPFPTDLHVEKC